MAVGQNGERLRVEEVVVPNRDEPEEHGHVLLDRRRAEVVVHEVKSAQHVVELVRADRDHQRQADRGVVRIASADPIPELEHVGRIDSELPDAVLVRRHGDEVFGDRRVVAERIQDPLPRRVRVRHRLEGGERLRAHHEERLVGIQIVSELPELVAIDVRYESATDLTITEVLQCVVGHVRAQVAAPDTDVDHVPDPADRYGRSRLRSAPIPQNARIFSEYAVHVGNDVVTVDFDRPLRPEPGARRATPRGCSVMLIFSPANMRIAQFFDPGSPCQVGEQTDCLSRQPVLRVVEVEAPGLQMHRLPAVGLGGEELTEMCTFDAAVVVDERAPLIASR